MSNPLLELTPNKVSRDIGSYVTYIYGAPKVGKSRFAAEFPDAIFFASEPTQNTIPGIMKMDITSWGEFKKMVRYLKDDEVKKKFKTVVLDTVDLLAQFCERYICSQEGVEDLKDIAWGAGYGKVEREFEQTLRNIMYMGYGLVMISHVTTGTFTREDGSEYNKTTPAVNSKRCKAVVENLADIYGYIHTISDENGNSKQVITLRAADDSVSGGNHFKYMVPQVDLSYAALSQAVSNAIDEDEKHCGNSDFFTDARMELPEEKHLDFEAMMTEFNDLTHKIQKSAGDEFKSKWAPKIVEITNKYLGVGKKVNDCTSAQAEQLELILIDLKDLVGQGL